MRRSPLRRVAALACACAIALGTAGASAAGPPGFVMPGKDEKCPVCGMFVSKYPDWVGQILYRDGSRAFFDGAKDLFRSYFDAKQHGGNRRAPVAAVFVTDFYTLEPIDGIAAFYVIGSDVLGPMGRELIPFAARADAEKFLRDHGGRRVIVLDQIEQELGSIDD